MAVPVEERPAGWERHPWAWEQPHAKVGYGKDGVPYSFPICDLCGHCCGHVQAGILSCEECKARRALIREVFEEVLESDGRWRCWSCGKVFRQDDPSRVGISSDTDGVVTECPSCGNEAEPYD